MDATNQELIGTLDEIESMLAFAHESLDASDDATVKASAPTVLAYAAKLRQMLEEFESSVQDRIADAG